MECNTNDQGTLGLTDTGAILATTGSPLTPLFIVQDCCWEGGAGDVHSTLGLMYQGSLEQRFLRLE